MIWKERTGSLPEEPEGIGVVYIRNSAEGWELILFQRINRRSGFQPGKIEGLLQGEQNQSGASLIKQRQRWPEGASLPLLTRLHRASTSASDAPPPAGRWVEVFSFVAAGAFAALWFFLRR